MIYLNLFVDRPSTEKKRKKDMSKTLNLQRLYQKFIAIASFCSATEHSTSYKDNEVLLTASFPDKKESPCLLLKLEWNENRDGLTVQNVMLTHTVKQIVTPPEDSSYLDPIWVLWDLGKTPSFIDGPDFIIRTPAELEAFFVKYAHLSVLFRKPCVFHKLLEIK